MHEPAPTFTVVVPLYNTERYIAATLDCVLAQTCGDFEVVVVDDASTDQGPQIARGYASWDPRIRVVTQENRGLAGARNTGIRYARGRYIALLDADDLWAARKLELHKAHLDARDEVGVSYAGSIFIDEIGDDIGITQAPKLDGIDLEHIFCRNPVGNGSAAVLRRTMLDDIAFKMRTSDGERMCWFDESFRQSEDIELWTRIAVTTNWVFAGLAEPLTYYRVNNGGLSANTANQFHSWSRVRTKLSEAAPDLISRFGAKAEGYQHRYLARRAAMSGDGTAAIGALHRSLAVHPRIIVEEPMRTLITMLLTLLALVLPARLLATVKYIAFASVRGVREATSSFRAAGTTTSPHH